MTCVYQHNQVYKDFDDIIIHHVIHCIDQSSLRTATNPVDDRPLTVN